MGIVWTAGWFADETRVQVLVLRSLPPMTGSKGNVDSEKSGLWLQWMHHQNCRSQKVCNSSKKVLHCPIVRNLRHSVRLTSLCSLDDRLCSMFKSEMLDRREYLAKRLEM